MVKCPPSQLFGVCLVQGHTSLVAGGTPLSGDDEKFIIHVVSTSLHSFFFPFQKYSSLWKLFVSLWGNYDFIILSLLLFVNDLHIFFTY